MPELSLTVFEEFMRVHLDRREKTLHKSAPRLFESIKYSLFSGGKRFRPQVVLATANMLDISSQRVLPLAAAIEFIHTYSLIHDDLPCMDDDDLRRGQPTNHRVFSEAEALLAGDGLLTEAFSVIGESYVDAPEVGLALIQLVSEAAGINGMVAGQVIDMQMQKPGADMPKADTVQHMLSLKTGALIRLCVEGVAAIARKEKVERHHLRIFGEHLGLAFQLADDLLDFNPDAVEPSGLPSVIGVKETEKKLVSVSNEALNILRPYGQRAEFLRALVDKNLKRKI